MKIVTMTKSGRYQGNEHTGNGVLISYVRGFDRAQFFCGGISWYVLQMPVRKCAGKSRVLTHLLMPKALY